MILRAAGSLRLLARAPRGALQRHVAAYCTAPSAAAAAGPAAPTAAAPAQDAAIPDYVPPTLSPITVVRKLGLSLLHDPITNRGTAFNASERERLGLRGLLPPRVTSLSWQKSRFLDSFHKGEKLVPADALEASIGVTEEMAVKWKRLQALQDRNETLFYMLLNQHFETMAPLIYTPTVGWACVNYSRLYRRPRGMFFSIEDKGVFDSMVLNWPNDPDAVVVTDGSRILGLGDLGLNGIAISIGKGDLYCSAAGFAPSKVLPVVLDVGTDNPRLLRDPLYVGVRKPRVKGRAYVEVVDELMGALSRRWPKCVIQFEDFSIDVARPLLNRYRNHHVCFNDDIQGTACVALGGLYSAMRAQGLPREALARQRVVVVGAGSAGMGVVETVAQGMSRSADIPLEKAAARFWVLDKDGLVTRARPDLPGHVAPFARRQQGELVPGEAGGSNGDDDDEESGGLAPVLADAEGEDLLSVVRRVRPTILLGLAGAGKLFTPDVLRSLADGCAAHGGRGGLARRPVVFAMSNPTSKLECTSQEAHDHTGGAALYASGSPQPDVVVSDGGSGSPTTTKKTSQCNNLFVFGGVALGTSLAKSRSVTDGMLMAAAEVLPELVSDADLAKGALYPPLSEIRQVSAAVAAAVMRAANADGLVTDGTVLGALQLPDVRLREWVARRMWRPSAHTSLAYLPPGVGE